MTTVIQIFQFIQDELLALRWLEKVVGASLASLGLEAGTQLFGTIQFFLYDSIKIFYLLSILIFGISYIQSYFPPERMRQKLQGIHGLGGRCLGALLGIITPFCSCSSIPLFIGFCRAGLPIGITLAFLIMSPMADLGSLTLLLTLFGWKIAFAYLVAGFAIAVIGGTLIECLGFGEHIIDLVGSSHQRSIERVRLSRRARFRIAVVGVTEIVRRVWIYILIGIGIGATIHNVIPQEIVQALLGGNHWYSVLLASLVGIPMYADIFGAIPIAEALLTKGAGLGTVMSFMMSVTALSLPAMVMLSKVMKPKLLITFVAVVSIGIILIGYGFNLCSHIFI